jgi:serine/threonine protein kinase
MAPEVLWSNNTKYTVATDIWALGARCVRLITDEEPAFPEADLFRYYDAERLFTPDGNLARRSVWEAGCACIRALTAQEPKLRLSAERAAQNTWIIKNRSPSAGLLDVLKLAWIESGAERPDAGTPASSQRLASSYDEPLTATRDAGDRARVNPSKPLIG